MTVARRSPLNPAAGTARGRPRGREARAPETPQRLITTVLGAYVRRLGNWLAIADLVRLMERLDVDEQSARSAVSRLKRRGFLETERRGRAAGYRLSEEALRIMAAADRRIYRTSETWESERWILVLFSVPEALRHHRHVLRSRLEWLGFGNAASGVWVAPAHVTEEVVEMLERHDLRRYTTLFRGEYLGAEDLRALVARWWNLEQLGLAYRAFGERFGPVLARWEREPAPDPADAFVDYVRALTHWRRLPFFDPGLPAEGLPADWEGHRAAALFAGLRDRLEAPARAYVDSVVIRPA